MLNKRSCRHHRHLLRRPIRAFGIVTADEAWEALTAREGRMPSPTAWALWVHGLLFKPSDLRCRLSTCAQK